MDGQREIPENENGYPEPSMFGITPASAFYIRHVRGLSFDNVDVSFDGADGRPAFVLADVSDAEFFRTNARLSGDAKMFKLTNVSNFNISHSRNLAGTKIDHVVRKEF